MQTEDPVQIQVDEILDANGINLIRVINPFDPRDHARSVVPYTPSMTVADALPPLMAEMVVSVNGAVIPLEDWSAWPLAAGDSMVVCPVPQKGGAKAILGAIAMIAVAIFAAPLAGMLAPMLGLGTFGTAMLTVGITLAGSMLVHALLAPSKPTPNHLSTSSGENSPTYGIDGPKNTSIEGIPVPICYGHFRMAGNVLNLHVDNVGKTQDLYVLLNAGEGVVQGLDDIRINDNPYTQYPNVEVQTRLGDNQQGTIAWFNDSVVPHSINAKLAGDGTWTPYVTESNVDRIRVDLVAPQGVYSVDLNTGKALEFTVPIEVQYAVHNSGNWQSMARADGGASEFRSDLRSVARLSWDSGPLTVNATYDVRFRRGTLEMNKPEQYSDVIYVSDVNEILMDPFTYPNTALVGLKIRLGEQLASLPTITFMNHGKVINVWNGNSWSQGNSNNPAWIVWDILTNSLYGAGMASSRLNLSSFKKWADFCDAKGFTFNGVLDTEMNVWDATQYVLRAGRAQLVNVGTRWSVVIEAEKLPTMMFSVANMVHGSYKETWLPMTDRANEVDVTYFDQADNYKRHTLKVYDPISLAAGQKQKTAAVTLYGIVDADRAFNEGMFMLNLNRFVLKTITFSAPMEAIACTVGDLIYVQHDMPHWADSGRISPTPIAP